MSDRGAGFRRYYEGEDPAWCQGSGDGSNPTATLPYRTFLENFMHLNNISSVVDIGCGDWMFSRYIDWSDRQYRGYDVVESVIERNRSRFAGERIRFDVMPDDLAEIPSADLLIMKDVLQHLPDQEIYRHKTELFDRFPRCLITNSYRKEQAPQNVDITTYGDFRSLDLTAAPYHFPGNYVVEYKSKLFEDIRTLLYIGKQ